MISRRRFITGFVMASTPLGATATAQEYKAQQTGKVPRIALLQPGVGRPAFFEAFRQGLRDLGYVEGQTIIIEFRLAREPTEQHALLAELVSLKVDVLVTWSTPAALAAKRATSTIPIVAMTGDPTRTGLAASLARSHRAGTTFIFVKEPH